MSRYNTVKDAAKDALAIQDACNLSGVLHAWADMQRSILDLGLSAEDTRRHPVNVLLLSKVLSLTGMGGDCLGGVERDGKDLFRGAYDACHTLSES